MDDLKVHIQCDQSNHPFNMLAEDFEERDKDGEPILCPDCMVTFLAKQAEQGKPPKRCFEYQVVAINESVGDTIAILNKWGSGQWRLITVDRGIMYFEREYVIEAE